MIVRTKVSIFSSLLFVSLSLLGSTRSVQSFGLSPSLQTTTRRTTSTTQLCVIPPELAVHHLLETYSGLLQTHPIATKCSTAAVLSCLGDAIAQYGASTNEDYDKKRGATFLFFGAIYTGFFQHYWFAYLASHIQVTASTLPLATIDSATLTAVTKVIVNQGVAIAGLYMPLFLILTAWLGDMNVQQGWERAQSLYAPLVRRNWTFWIPTQFVQFAMIPDVWHIPFLSVMSLVWTIILSTMGSVSKQQQQTASDESRALVVATEVKNKQKGTMMRRSRILTSSSAEIMEQDWTTMSRMNNNTETPVYASSRRMAMSNNAVSSSSR